MAEHTTNPQEPAIGHFPLFGEYEAMVAEELEGLTDPQLDWTSPNWGWSGWSIRNNISHVASHLFRWYILRWGDQIFPEGIPYRDEVDYLAALPHRQLDKEQWWEINVILGKLGEAIEMVHGILRRETMDSLRAKTIEMEGPGFYDPIAHRYPGTLLPHPTDPNLRIFTLEGCFHHSEGELVTHLYNCQRLKRAQGLTAHVELPKIGYWTLPDWDTTEP